MSYSDGRVALTARVDPALRDHAREAARAAGVEFSRWVERALQQAMARESADRLYERGAFECSICHRETNAADGGVPDEYDPNGDMCSECWCAVKEAAERCE